MTDLQPNNLQPNNLQPDNLRLRADGEDLPSSTGPRLGAADWSRWVWRQLTSMRTALLLLLLLAVGSIPGSIFPQTRIDSNAVDAFLAQHATIGPWLQRFGMFDVYASPWFSSIYLLLFISLIGCVIPRIGVHLRALRQAPPATPSRLERLPVHLSTEVAGTPADILAAAVAVLRARRYRVVRIDPSSTNTSSVAAQRGYLAETGNLLFHLALLLVLSAVAVGSMVSYTGQTIVIEGDQFANVLPQYNTFRAGNQVDTGNLTPFTIKLLSLKVVFEKKATGAQFGAPRAFDAMVQVTERPGATPYSTPFTVNHPIDVHGARIFLTGNGYAPVVTVRDGRGKVVKSGPSIFLPRDGNYRSMGVIKVPDVNGDY